MPTNFIQLSILKALLTKPLARFSELNLHNTESDLLTFHLKQLMKNSLIAKEEKIYHLTTKGLEIAGRIDLQTSLPVEQPKMGVMIFVFKKQKGKLTHILLGKRKKDPSINLVGPYTEKVILGESFESTCLRCLQRETGLTSKKFIAQNYQRNIFYKDKELKQDVILFEFICINPKGNLLSSTLDSENRWYELNEIKHIPNKFLDLEKDIKRLSEKLPPSMFT